MQNKRNNNLNTHKGQLWSLDFFVGVLIFLFGFLAFYAYLAQATILMGDDMLRDLVIDAKIISDKLVSSGQPTEWTSSNVSSAGLTDGGVHLVSQKVLEFAAIAQLNYSHSKELIATQRDYHIRFNDNAGQSRSIGNITSIGQNYSIANPAHLITTSRILFYNSSIIEVVITIW